jgi:uncharacterized short protein YbdD (DUF466 family)
MIERITTRAARAARGLGRLVRGVMGEGAYDAYLAHERAAHPGAPLLSEREFWIARYRDQELNPGGRCC